MKALITGGAGFIGYHLTRDLLEQGYEIVIADNLSRGVEDKFLKELEDTGRIKFISADLMEKENVMSLGDDYDYIWHLAAIIGVQNVLRQPYNVLTKNVELTANLIELGHMQKHLKRFIFASTSEIYAGTLQFFGMEIPTPEDTPLAVTPLDHPRTSYMLSKIYGEALVIASGLPYCIQRPHNYYGPRMGMSHVIPELLKKAYFAEDGSTLDVYSVDHKRTFCYVGDAVKMMRMLAESDSALNQAFNVGNQAPEITIREVAETVIKVVGKDLTINPLPATPGSPERRCPSMEKTKAAIGFEGTIMLEEGVKKTFDWYKKYIFDGNELSAK